MVDKITVGNSSKGIMSPGAWAYSLLVVFILGVSTVVVTRILLYVHHPKYFLHTIPSISKTAAFAPGSYIFTVGMTVVSACIVITWVLIFKLNNHRINLALLDHAWIMLCRILNFSACVCGITAGVYLALLSNISLEANSDFHINYSKYFFFLQTLSFIIDTVCVSITRRASPGKYVYDYAFHTRAFICIIVFLDALFFQYLFENRDSGIFSDRHFAQQIYILAEHTIAFLSFSYSAAYFPEVYKYFNSSIIFRHHHEIKDISSRHLQ